MEITPGGIEKRDWKHETWNLSINETRRNAPGIFPICYLANISLLPHKNKRTNEIEIKDYI